MIKILKSVLMVSVCTLIMSNNLNAAEPEQRVIPDNCITSQEPQESEVTEVFEWNFNDEDGIMPYGTYFAFGRAGIAKESSSSVYISGSTSCYENCATVKVNITLQKLKNGSWRYVTERSNTEYNTAFSSVSDTISVESGYYYRVVSVHSATKNGKTETGAATSSNIYVG